MPCPVSVVLLSSVALQSQNYLTVYKTKSYIHSLQLGKLYPTFALFAPGKCHFAVI